jgi:hypothetical protein
MLFLQGLHLLAVHVVKDTLYGLRTRLQGPLAGGCSPGRHATCETRHDGAVIHKGMRFGGEVNGFFSLPHLLVW